MSTILRVVRVPGHGLPRYWLTLDCGHRYKWSGPRPPQVGTEIACPEDSPITVEDADA